LLGEDGYIRELELHRDQTRFLIWQSMVTHLAAATLPNLLFQMYEEEQRRLGHSFLLMPVLGKKGEALKTGLRQIGQGKEEHWLNCDLTEKLRNLKIALLTLRRLDKHNRWVWLLW
jgi:hypothetical protein